MFEKQFHSDLLVLGSFCWLFLGDHLQLVKSETKGDPQFGARRLHVLLLASVCCCSSNVKPLQWGGSR